MSPGPAVAVWISREMAGIANVTVVPGDTVRLDGRKANSSTPPLPAAPRPTVLVGDDCAASVLATAAAALPCLATRFASAFADGILPFLTRTVPAMPGWTLQRKWKVPTFLKRRIAGLGLSASGRPVS